MCIHRRAVLALLLVIGITTIAEQKEPLLQLPRTWLASGSGSKKTISTSLVLSFSQTRRGTAPASPQLDTILHSYGVQLYRVDRWSIEGWNLTSGSLPYHPMPNPFTW